MQLVRRQQLLLLAAMIVAHSLRIDGRLQREPQHGSSQADIARNKPASGQTPGAFAGQLYNTQKLLEFDRGGTPVHKAIALWDYMDGMEDHRVREQVAQAGSSNVDITGGNEQGETYGVLPARPLTWSKRRRRIGVSGELRLGEAPALDRPPCSSSGTSPGCLGITPSGRQLEHPCAWRAEDKEEGAQGENNGSYGQFQQQAEKEQTEAAEKPQTFDGVTSWNKRVPPFSILAAARRRALRSRSGKRVPAFHSWGGKRSSPSAALDKGSNWGEVPAIKRLPAFSSWGGKRNYPAFRILTDTDGEALGIVDSKRLPAFSSWGGKRNHPAFSILTDTDGEAFRIVDSKRLPAFSSWGGKRDLPAFSILTDTDGEALRIVNSKLEPEYSILGTEGDTPVSMWNTNDDILASHDQPAFIIAGENYPSTPALGIFGSKRDSASSDEGRKRDPAFYSWGGKRDSAFSPWGGKNGLAFSNWDEKTGSLFSSLSAKGDVEVPNWVLGPEVTNRGNRFSDWGAKKAVTESEDFEERHRENVTIHSTEKQNLRELDGHYVKYGNARSSPAEAHEKFPGDLDGRVQLGTLDNNGGKATSEDDVATSESQERERTNHQNAAGGPELPGLVAKRSAPSTSGKNRVGKAFSPWGGKRSEVPAPLLSVWDSMQGPDSPGSLSGLLIKRGNYRHLSVGSKKWDPSSVGTVFSSWGGKRSVKPTEQNMLKVPPQGTGRQFRRGADFYSWGGKR